MFPISASLYSMDCANANANRTGDGGKGNVMMYKHFNQNNMAFIKYCAAIFRTFMRAMGDGIVNIFIFSAVCEIIRSIIKSVSINMPYDGAIWTRSVKGMRYNAMYCRTFLRSIKRAFFEGYGKVVRRGIRLADKPFPISNSGNSSKITYLISIMAFNRFPNFRSVCHG